MWVSVMKSKVGVVADRSAKVAWARGWLTGIGVKAWEGFLRRFETRFAAID